MLDGYDGYVGACVEESVFGIIYMARNTVNGKVYIGQTIKTLDFRKRQHINSAFNKNDENYKYYWHCAIRKYGIDSFEWNILYEGIPENLLSPTERFVIASYNAFGDGGYNSTCGGDENPMTGKHHSQETKAKIGEANKGKYISPETRKKISEAKKGNTHNTTETKIKMSIAHMGKMHSPEEKNKISLAHIGMTLSSEIKDKIAISKGSKPFHILKDGIVVGTYTRKTDCADKYGINRSSVSACLNGKRNKAHGYTFIYVKDYLIKE